MILQHLASIITFFFLLIIISYYLLLFINKKYSGRRKKFKSITIIVPAHNEEPYIKDCLNAIVNAKFVGTKQIIAIDDGSIDNTAKIIANYKNVKLIKSKHQGKAASINEALKIATGEIIGIVDADSIIKADALTSMAKVLGQKNVAGVTGVIGVQNRLKFVNLWTHIEQLYNSLMRSLLSKLNANIVTPGPLSMYRKDCLAKIGGFSTDGFSEDIDITIKLIRSGYTIGFAQDSVSLTNLPYKPKDFFRQRTRFARGAINIFKKHLKINNAFIDIYTLPIFLFTYVQAIIIGSFTLYQLGSGYHNYFLSQGIYLSVDVFKFFFEWFSIIGFIKWSYAVITGVIPLSFTTLVGVLSSLLSYPLYFIAILKFDKKFDIYHLIPLFFMFPFWLLIMIVYIICLPEVLRKKQHNIWKKNE